MAAPSPAKSSASDRRVHPTAMLAAEPTRSITAVEVRIFLVRRTPAGVDSGERMSRIRRTGFSDLLTQLHPGWRRIDQVPAGSGIDHADEDRLDQADH